jgi:hypothetical protein
MKNISLFKKKICKILNAGYDKDLFDGHLKFER